MGRNHTSNVERAHPSRSRSQPSVSQEPKRKKKRQNNEEITGRKPPKSMPTAQAKRILAKKDLWGYRMFRNGFDPEKTAGAPPAASVIDFNSGGQSYAMSMDLAICGKSSGLEDLVEKEKPKYISQAGARMRPPIPPQANPGGHHMYLNPPPPSNLPPNPPAPTFEFEQLLWPGTPFAHIRHSPQPSEYSEFGSESTDSFYAGSGTGSPADFGAPASYFDMVQIPMEQLSLSQMGLAGPSTLNVPRFQEDWTANYDVTTSFQNSGSQAPAPFPFDHSNMANTANVPLTTMFDYPTTGAYPEGPYPGANAMPSQNF
ncbi:hypothetical protein EST38_g6476 [Candolleomyces aberdarensis]|uniref:Uncharacterized protein n=1 Tax=Candolleomyces aberdarensis TaxID=2316362 RepID=A0A4Q2DJK3_9AGAR|nr:hypothetical protein EST38_g6476 [Candolleomyces aberdarensis]